MSRKGKLPIPLPKGVEAKIEKNKIAVTGPKGSVVQTFPEEISVKEENGQLIITVAESADEPSRLHGLYRTLIFNAIEGCSKGFSKVLKLIGVGYRAAVKGHQVDLQIGNSHPTLLDIPEGIKVEIEKSTTVTISGADRQVVGQFAASIRSKKPPEPFQGKGIRYENEFVRRKAGKSAAK